MKAELKRFGNEQCPVVVLDDFSGDPGKAAALADDLAPFPNVSSGYYPGVRRLITEADEAAFAYVQDACREASQYLAGAFEIDGFELLEASFSIVSQAPSLLSPPQRAPHFDSTDPLYFALLHYLRVPRGTGTAFYRQRSTGIEQVTEANVDRFVATAKTDSARLATDSGYIQGSDDFFERIGAVEAIPDRFVIYQGSLLHSGIIPPDMALSADPREGRLTANIFVRGYRNA